MSVNIEFRFGRDYQSCVGHINFLIYIFNYKCMYDMIISGVDNSFFKHYRRLLLTFMIIAMTVFIW